MNVHLFDSAAASERDIVGSVGLVSQRVLLTCALLQPLTLAHDRWQGWGAEVPAPPQAVHLYTDGSFDAATGASAWAVTVGDQWFDASVGGIPSDEKLVTSVHVAGAVTFGASIEGTRGVFFFFFF